MASKKKKKGKKNHLDIPISAYIFPIGVAVIIIVSMYLVLRPQVLGISEIRDDIESQEKELAVLVRKKDSLEGHSEETLKDYLETVNRVLPENKPVFRFVNGLSGLSGEHPGVSVGDYTINPGSLATGSAESSSEPGELSTMKTELEVKGEYGDIIEYLESLHKLAPMIGIKSIDVKGKIDPNQVGEQSISIAMDVDVFFALSPDNIGKVTDALPKYSGDFEITKTELETFETYADVDTEILDIDQNRENPFSF